VLAEGLHERRPESFHELRVEAEVVDVVLARQPAPRELQEVTDGPGVERADPIGLGGQVDATKAGVTRSAVPAALAVRGDRPAPSRLTLLVAKGDHLRHQVRASSICSWPRRRRNA
jgi:hypothetical protein